MIDSTITVGKLNKLEDGITVFPLNFSHEFIFDTEDRLIGFVSNSHKKGYTFSPPDSLNHELVEKHYPKDYKMFRIHISNSSNIDCWKSTLWDTDEDDRSAAAIAYSSYSIIKRFIWDIAKNTVMTEEQVLKLLIASNDVYAVMEAGKLANKGFCYDTIYGVVCRGLDLTEKHCKLFNNKDKS